MAIADQARQNGNAPQAHQGMIGARIREARLSAGLTQQALADRITPRTMRQHVYNWERGTRTPSEPTLVRIAHALGTTPAWLRYGIRND